MANVLKTLALTLAGFLAACGSGGSVQLDPATPPSGLDTTTTAMRDGAGNPGPIRVRLATVSPPLNVKVLPNVSSGECSKAEPYTCFQFQAEICMDAVANPTNSILLRGMGAMTTFSADGVTPILTSSGGPTGPGPGSSGSVTAGGCLTLKTEQGNSPPFPSGGVPRYIIFFAVYGAGTVVTPNTINLSACPTPANISAGSVSGQPLCSFRRAYDLGYHF